MKVRKKPVFIILASALIITIILLLCSLILVNSNAYEINNGTVVGDDAKIYSSNEIAYIVSSDTDKIVLSQKGTLYRENKKTKKKVKLADNIQKYYLGERIVVQNSTQIISLSYDGKDIREVKKNAILKGYNDEIVYYTKLKEEQSSSTKKFTLYKMNLDTMEEEKDMQSDKYIRSVIFKDGEMKIKSIEE